MGIGVGILGVVMPPWYHHVAWLLFPIAMGFLLRNAGRSDRQAGRQTLSYDWIPRTVSVGGVFLIAFVGVFSVLTGRHVTPVTWAEFAFCGVIGLWLMVESFGTKIIYDASEIYCLSPWRADRTIPWTDIASITYSRRMRAFFCRTSHSGTVCIFIYISGWRLFLQEARRRGIPIGGDSRLY
jgi:hypothetical protein